MKHGFSKYMLAAGVALLLVYPATRSYVGTYDGHIPRTVTVLGKESDARNFYLIVQDDRGLRFSESVGPATFHLNNKGDTVVLRIRDMDHISAPGKAFASFIGFMSLPFGVMFGIGAIVTYLIDRRKK